jgi:predicted deacylase
VHLSKGTLEEASMKILRVVRKLSLHEYPQGKKYHLRYEILRLADGTPVSIPVVLVVGSASGSVVTFFAGVHGDEFEGPKALWDAAFAIEPTKLSGTVILIPICNPLAYRAGQRTTPEDSLNLNRVFPGKDTGAITERIAHALFNDFVLQSDVIVDFHSGGTYHVIVPIMGYYNLGGELARNSFELAKSTHFSYLWQAPHRSGVLTYEAVKAGILAIGGECGGGGRCLKENVEMYTRSVFRILSHLGLLEAQKRLPSSKCTVLTKDYLAAQMAGCFELNIELNDHVEAGKPIGLYRDVFGHRVGTISSLHNGIVIGKRVFPTVSPGEALCFILEPTVDVP